MKRIFSLRHIAIGLFVGTLDISAAFIQFFLKTNKNPIAVLKFIASGVFGDDAFTGGNDMILWGLAFHFVIALAFAFFFFWLSDKTPLILKFRFLTAILYGIFIWSTMQFLVLPLSNAPRFPFDIFHATMAILILIGCIGIPLSFMGDGKMRNSLFSSGGNAARDLKNK